MKKVIIIGGGFAGLSAAASLANAGFLVEVIEASSKPGGRAYSFTDKRTNSRIDNGQHILMGCYRHTLRFLKLINAEKNFFIQKKLEVNFLKPRHSLYKLKAFPLPYPFSLLFGILTYKAVPFNERLKILRFFIRLYFYPLKKLEKLTVYEWLELEGQTENVRKAFWEIIAVGALNTSIKKASAKTFSDILKKMFFSGNKSASILLPLKRLSESFCDNAESFLKKYNAAFNYSEEATELIHDGKNITGIRTSKRVITSFDYVITAVPPFALQRMLPEYSSAASDFEYSAIINIHIWLKENKLTEKFYGLINSPVHWIFNNDEYLTLVISDADHLAAVSKEEIFDIAREELCRFAGIGKDLILNYKVIKEKRATFVPSKNILHKRPDSQTSFNNMFIAGDWIKTGLPSTIESAVKSGRKAAELVIKNT